MKSMTGFGRGEATTKGVRAEVELSSVNRKQLDVRISLPRSLASLESRVAKETSKMFSRGHITGTIGISSARPQSEKVRIDDAAAASYVAELRRAARKLTLKDDLSASSLLELPSILVAERVALSPNTCWSAIRKALGLALSELSAMRAKEGQALKKDLSTRFESLRALLERVASLAPNVQSRYRKNLLQRLRKAGVTLTSASSELARELAIFADRSDISEEVTRLRSHLAQGDALLSKSSPSGRTLDFLAQEMFREINTIGSKANDARISKHVIKFKTELERAREQIQNVE